MTTYSPYDAFTAYAAKWDAAAADADPVAYAAAWEAFAARCAKAERKEIRRLKGAAGS